APVKDVTATTPSPPGRFSITTDWPQRADSLSASRRAVMSTPEPGPSGRMNLTGRCGQLGAGVAVDCAYAVPGSARATNNSAWRNASFTTSMTSLLDRVIVSADAFTKACPVPLDRAM